MLHPEKRSKCLSKKSTSPGPNESTSAKKTPKGLRRAGQGKQRDGKRGGKAHKDPLHHQQNLIYEYMIKYVGLYQYQF